MTPVASSEPNLVWDSDLNEENQVLGLGGKALGLIRLKSQGFNVPRFCVLLPDADVELAVGAITKFEGAQLAVRSSAEGEDGQDASFAGMYETILGVRTADELREAVRHCRAAITSERVQAYRQQHGLSESPLAIIVQELVDGSVSGVLFTHDPIMPERSIVSAAYGLGEGVVQGTVPCDTFWVSLQEEIQQELTHKDQAARLVDGRVQTMATELNDPLRSCLSDDQLRRLSKMGAQLSGALGGPQDIEWTLKDGEIVLLQTRPITVSIPDGVRLLWDNSNIIESYYGPTLPLTYSFASRSYTIVYQLFCEVMGVSASEIRKNSETFAKLIGLVKGRIYYNLNAWYRVVSLLPGYQWNREFLEQMMGVSEVASDQDAAPVNGLGRVSSLFRLIRLSAVLGWRSLTLDRRIVHFQRTVDSSIQLLDPKELMVMRPEELLHLYAKLERKLLWAWSTPIINDFFVMIAHGVLKSLSAKWLPDVPNLSNRLISQAGDMISARPAILTREMAMKIQPLPDLVEEFHTFSRAQISGVELREKIRRYASVERVFEQYMREVGHRCADELKLETRTYHHDPSPLFKSVFALLGRDLPPIPVTGSGAEQKIVDGRLGGWRRWLFNRVADWTTKRVRARENLRYDRTRVFAVVRDIFRSLGQHLADSQAIDHPRDVFYLEAEEVFGWVRGTGTTVGLDELVRIRKAEYQRWALEPAPADRFWTWGPVWKNNHFVAATSLTDQTEPGWLKGLAAYPGVVEGVVRCVQNPQEEQLRHGEILVCYRTDPGWVPLFSAAAAILVERGSLLSHSAVVARELSIPTIVAIPNLLQTLKTGQRIRIDASVGTIEILE